VVGFNTVDIRWVYDLFSVRVNQGGCCDLYPTFRLERLGLY